MHSGIRFGRNWCRLDASVKKAVSNDEFRNLKQEHRQFHIVLVYIASLSVRRKCAEMGVSMISKRLGIIGFVSAAGIVSGILAGCGGSGSIEGLGATINASGGLTTASGGGTPGTSSGSTPQQVQVTVNGNVVTGTLPANQTIPASGVVSTIAPGIPILTGLTLAPKTHINVHTPTVSNGIQGEVDVDGCDTGLRVDSAGNLSGYLFLVPGAHNITAIGPFDIIGGSAFNPTTLTVGKFVFNVTVNPDGIASIPSALQVNLPINGGTLKAGHYVKVTYPTPDFAAGNGTLTLSWPGDTIQKTQPVVNGKVTFKALTNSTLVPMGGVATVQYDYVH